MLKKIFYITCDYNASQFYFTVLYVIHVYVKCSRMHAKNKQTKTVVLFTTQQDTDLNQTEPSSLISYLMKDFVS